MADYSPYARLENMSTCLPNASPEYQEMMRNIMKANKDKPVEEVAEMLMHIDQTTARLTNDYVKIMANNKEK